MHLHLALVLDAQLRYDQTEQVLRAPIKCIELFEDAYQRGDQRIMVYLGCPRFKELWTTTLIVLASKTTKVQDIYGFALGFGLPAIF